MELKGKYRAKFYNAQFELLRFHISPISSFHQNQISTYIGNHVIRSHLTHPNALRLIVDHSSTPWVLFWLSKPLSVIYYGVHQLQ